MTFDIAGLTVGTAQDEEARTGCHVVLCADGAVVGCDVRGGAPGTRETDLCRTGMLVERANAILLAGGSAFGLAAADGVMRWLWERDAGFRTPAGRVPIVPAAVIYDLEVGMPVWPDADMGRRACEVAGNARIEGRVGAGAGATVGKLFGTSSAMDAGAGAATVRCGDYRVAALVVVNAFGNVVDPDHPDTILAGACDPNTRDFVDIESALLSNPTPAMGGTNTTIGVVATDAALGKAEVNAMARASHDGLARAIKPAHTIVDGDTMFALATGARPNPLQGYLVALCSAAAVAAAQAVVRAVAIPSS